jgi:hypothetical protein
MGSVEMLAVVDGAAMASTSFAASFDLLVGEMSVSDGSTNATSAKASPLDRTTNEIFALVATTKGVTRE